MRRLRVATGNRHKLQEFGAILGPLGYHIEGPPGPFEIEETGDSFVANAILKAEALVQLTHEAAVADDSGLEVDALGGAPGVRSARYARPEGPSDDAANRQKLLQALASVPEGRRAARFVCVVALCMPGQAPLLFNGVVEGRIALAEAGSGGFGYDSLFVPHGELASFAELPPARKHLLSHRGNALRALEGYLRQNAPPGVA